MNENTKILELNEKDLTGKVVTTFTNNGDNTTELGAIKQACRELNEQKENRPLPDYLKLEHDEKEYSVTKKRNESGEEVTQIFFGIECKTNKQSNKK